MGTSAREDNARLLLAVLGQHLVFAEANSGELAGKLLNLLAENLDLRDVLAIGNKFLKVLDLLGANLTVGFLGDLDSAVNETSNLGKVLLVQTTGSHGRGTDTDTTGNHGRLVTGNSVLVGGNVDQLEDTLNTGTVNALGAEIDQDQVGVSAARGHLVAKLGESIGKGLAVGQNLVLVLLEGLGLGLLQGNGQGSNGVVVGTTLVTREDRLVDGVLKVVHDLVALLVGAADTLAEEDQGTTGATERLVGGGGDNVRVRERRGENIGSDQSRDVGHIGHQVSTAAVSNLAHASIVDLTGIGRGTSNDDLGAVELGVLLQGIVVNDTGLLVDLVGEGLKIGRDHGDLLGFGLVPVRQAELIKVIIASQSTSHTEINIDVTSHHLLSTVGEIETHETVVGLHESTIDVEVGGGTGQGLDVDAPLLGVQVEGLQGAFLAEALRHVDLLVTTIVSKKQIYSKMSGFDVSLPSLLPFVCFCISFTWAVGPFMKQLSRVHISFLTWHRGIPQSTCSGEWIPRHPSRSEK